ISTLRNGSWRHLQKNWTTDLLDSAAAPAVAHRRAGALLVHRWGLFKRATMPARNFPSLIKRHAFVPQPVEFPERLVAGSLFGTAPVQRIGCAGTPQLSKLLRREFFAELAVVPDELGGMFISHHSICIGTPLRVPQEVPFVMTQRGSKLVAELHARRRLTGSPTVQAA